MPGTRLWLSCGSWTPVWKVKLPLQLVGKEETPNSGILLGEGKAPSRTTSLNAPPPDFCGSLELD